MRTDLASKFLFLQKDQFKFALTGACVMNRTLRNFPEAHTKFVLNVFGSNYFQYYKNIVHKLRHDTRKAIEALEPFFFENPKPRMANLKGRDLCPWYNATEEIARKIEAVIEDKRSVPGFRKQLITAYRG